jgi:hypothetical protein
LNVFIVVVKVKKVRNDILVIAVIFLTRSKIGKEELQDLGRQINQTSLHVHVALFILQPEHYS